MAQVPYNPDIPRQRDVEAPSTDLDLILPGDLLNPILDRPKPANNAVNHTTYVTIDNYTPYRDGFICCDFSDDYGSKFRKGGRNDSNDFDPYAGKRDNDTDEYGNPISSSSSLSSTSLNSSSSRGSSRDSSLSSSTSSDPGARDDTFDDETWGCDEWCGPPCCSVFANPSGNVPIWSISESNDLNYNMSVDKDTDYVVINFSGVSMKGDPTPPVGNPGGIITDLAVIKDLEVSGELPFGTADDVDAGKAIVVNLDKEDSSSEAIGFTLVNDLRPDPTAPDPSWYWTTYPEKDAEDDNLSLDSDAWKNVWSEAYITVTICKCEPPPPPPPEICDQPNEDNEDIWIEDAQQNKNFRGGKRLKKICKARDTWDEANNPKGTCVATQADCPPRTWKNCADAAAANPAPMVCDNLPAGVVRLHPGVDLGNAVNIPGTWTGDIIVHPDCPNVAAVKKDIDLPAGKSDLFGLAAHLFLTKT